MKIATWNVNALRARLEPSTATLEEARSVVEADPTPEALVELSLRYYQRGRYPECAELCLQALEIDADYVPALNNLCAARNAMELWDDAIAACERALEIDPSHELAGNNLAWARERRDGNQSP